MGIRFGWLFVLGAVTACWSQRAPAMRETETPRAPAETKYRAVLDDVGVNRLPLFPDELAVLRRMAFDFLAGRPELGGVVPLEELDRLQAAAREGRVVEGGPVCAAPTPLWSLLRDRYGNPPRARVTADCHARPCELRVTVEQPPPREGVWKTLASWEAAVDDPLSIQAWRAAFAALAPPPPPSPGTMVMGVMSRGAAEPRLVTVDHLAAFGAWSGATAVTPTPQVFVGVQGALDACHVAGGSYGATEQGSLSIAPSGVVDRCALYLRDEDPALVARNPRRETCLCAALSNVAFGAAVGPRRLAVSFMNRPTPAEARGGRVYGARFDAVKTDAPWDVRPYIAASAGALGHCRAASGARGIVRVPVRLRVDGGGRVVDASAETDASIRGCVEEALRRTPFPCPPSSGPATVVAKLVLYDRPEGD
jgi:hypothetical protein